MNAKQIWVDADSCPKVIKEILFRAADRVGVQLTLVANHAIPVPRSPHIRTIQVASGFDVADNYIVQQAQAGDLVITADIPLASEIVDKNCLALNPRARELLMMRDALKAATPGEPIDVAPFTIR